MARDLVIVVFTRQLSSVWMFNWTEYTNECMYDECMCVCLCAQVPCVYWSNITSPSSQKNSLFFGVKIHFYARSTKIVFVFFFFQFFFIIQNILLPNWLKAQSLVSREVQRRPSSQTLCLKCRLFTYIPTHTSAHTYIYIYCDGWYVCHSNEIRAMCLGVCYEWAELFATESRRDSIHKGEEVVSSIQYIQLLVVRKAMNGRKK